jgi:aspartyl-tRNA(Asn)/glutamyl-tRNA(Gln) amidotransferase subunit B
LKELLNLLKYTKRTVDVGGVLRADVNISIEGGAKVEIKNINSVRGAFKAVQYEIVRQKQLMKRGAAVTQETRGFNEKSMITVSQRLKETAADYRYIPDPDIPPQQFAPKFLEGIELPETPQRLKKRLVAEYKIADKYAETLVRDKPLADAFLEVAKSGVDNALAAQWLCEEVTAQLNYRGIDYNESKLTTEILAEWIGLIKDSRITDIQAKKLLERFVDSGESPKKIVESESLGKMSDKSKQDRITYQKIEENPKSGLDYLSGEKKSLNYLMGQVMSATHGSANPDTVMLTLKSTLSDFGASAYPKTEEGIKEFIRKEKYEK